MSGWALYMYTYLYGYIYIYVYDLTFLRGLQNVGSWAQSNDCLVFLFLFLSFFSGQVRAAARATVVPP